jgi:hypothetical protein
MQTKATTQVHIQDPCLKNWNSMRLAEQGRFCKSCNKQVTDFTLFSDTELISFLADRQGSTSCGRFRPDQVKTVSGAFSFRDFFRHALRYAAISFIAFFFSKTGEAQGAELASAKNDDGKLPPSVKDRNNDSIIYLFQGSVSDQSTGEPLVLATVTVQKTSTEKMVVGYTDQEGNYRIEVPAMGPKEEFTLVITKGRYKSRVISGYAPSVEAQDFELKPKSGKSYSGRRYHRRGLFHRRRKYYVMGAFAYCPPFIFLLLNGLFG